MGILKHIVDNLVPLVDHWMSEENIEWVEKQLGLIIVKLFHQKKVGELGILS